jgi:c-di-GMP-binding flagellar brake protein YcgR
MSVSTACASYSNHDSQNISNGSVGKIWLTQTYPDTSIVFEADFRKCWVKPITLDQKQKRMGVTFIEMQPLQRDNLWRIIKRQQSQAKQIS